MAAGCHFQDNINECVYSPTLCRWQCDNDNALYNLKIVADHENVPQYTSLRVLEIAEG